MNFPSRLPHWRLPRRFFVVGVSVLAATILTGKDGLSTTNDLALAVGTTQINSVDPRFPFVELTHNVREGIRFRLIAKTPVGKSMLADIRHLRLAVDAADPSTPSVGLPIQVSFASLEELEAFPYIAPALGKYNVVLGIYHGRDEFLRLGCQIALREGAATVYPAKTEIWKPGTESKFSIAEIETVNALDLLFVLDRSASMTSGLNSAKEAAKRLFEEFNQRGRVRLRARLATFSHAKRGWKSDTVTELDWKLFPQWHSSAASFATDIDPVKAGPPAREYHEFQIEALFQGAQAIESKEDGNAMKLVVLITDERDEFYVSNPKAKIQWPGIETSRNALDLLQGVKDRRTAVAMILCHEQALGTKPLEEMKQHYDGILSEGLGEFYAGSFSWIHTDSQTSEEIKEGGSHFAKNVLTATRKLAQRSKYEVEVVQSAGGAHSNLLMPKSLVADPRGGFDLNLVHGGEWEGERSAIVLILLIGSQFEKGKVGQPVVLLRQP